MRILIAPDKFKGSLSAAQVIEHFGSGLTARGVAYTGCPLADGGDGSVQAALHAGFRPVAVTVAGPTGVPHHAELAFDGHTCVVEVANSCGLGLLPDAIPAPMTSSSRGLGEAIRAALEQKPRRLVLALGGSASTDGGAGMLAALGAIFTDETGQPLQPCGGNLQRIHTIDTSGLLDVSGIDIIVASDVDNPLTAENGAAAIYGPQKGATAADISALDCGLRNLVQRFHTAGFDQAERLSATPGAGAAGGLGFATLLLGATLVSGAGFFLDLLDFDGKVKDCDLVITGEGRMDRQTLQGKLPAIVARRAGTVPVIAVVGRNDLTRAELDELGIDAVYALTDLTEANPNADPALSARLLHDLALSLPLPDLRS